MLSSLLLPKDSNIKMYNILPVVLYGCETSSRTLNEENIIRVFDERMTESSSLIRVAVDSTRFAEPF
jgi:hypothetical protein